MKVVRSLAHVWMLLSLAMLARAESSRDKTLASLASGRGIRFGTEYFGSKGELSVPVAKTEVLREFNIYASPAYFHFVEPEENRFDFGIPDRITELAPRGAVMRVHNLIWCEYLPDWMENGHFTGARLKAILINHIRAVARHYRAKYPDDTVAWDVVNEPISWQGEKCPWHKIGTEAGLDEDEYIRLALRVTHEEAPKAKLYLNENCAEGMGEKSDRMFKLVSDLKVRGIPIDGVGLESHFTLEPGGVFPQMPPVKEIIENMNRIASLGLETMITEADFSFQDSKASPDLLAKQAKAYRDLLHACLSAKNCKAFITWGVGDGDSWIPEHFPGWGTPLLFDANYRPKPAYDAVKSELSF